MYSIIISSISHVHMIDNLSNNQYACAMHYIYKNHNTTRLLNGQNESPIVEQTELEFSRLSRIKFDMCFSKSFPSIHIVEILVYNYLHDSDRLEDLGIGTTIESFHWSGSLPV